MKTKLKIKSRPSENRFSHKLSNLAILSVVVPLVIFGASSVGKAEEFKPKQLIAQSCRNIEIRTNGKSRAFSRGVQGSTCGYRFKFQGDGNLVLSNSSGQVLWATGTEGRGKKLAIQGDGNIVIYGDRGALWATNTNGNPGAFFAIQADGNLVVYRSDGQQALWASGTDGGQSRTRNAAGEWSSGGQSKPQIQASQPSNQRESQRKINDFVNQWNGKTGIARYDLGREYNGQCVSLIARYLQDHYNASKSNLTIGNGAFVARKVGTEFSSFTWDTTDKPMPGSIVSFPSIGGGYGHVALVVSSQQNGANLNMQILDSNGDNAGINSVVRLRNITVDTRSWTAPGYGSILYSNPRD